MTARRLCVYSDGMLEVGDTFAGFVVEAHLGGGGAADVYRVRRAGDGPVALKVLHTDAMSHAGALDRFRREFGIAAMLRHPHIVAVYEFGEASSHPALRMTALNSTQHPPSPSALWMTMQYVDGPQAGVLIPTGSSAPDLTTVSEVIRQIGEALDYAHVQDVLHRDVKPSNILLNSDWTCAYLGDFGIAQLIDSVRPLAGNGRFAGSIAYAAPELLTGQHLSASTDLYALACTAFEWLTGAPPYRRPTPFAITYAHLRDPVPKLTSRRPWLPNGLNAVFAKALAKNPQDRYSTCAEFTDIVVRTLRGVSAPPEQRSRWYRGAKG